MAQYPQTVIVNTSANKSTLNTTVGSVISTGAATVNRVVVVVAGTAAGSVNDTTAVSLAGAANQIASAPTIAGSYAVDMPVNNGIVLVPGTGQTLALSWRKP